MSYDNPIHLEGPRRDVFSLAVMVMRDSEWKNTVAPDHDHAIGSEQGMTHARDGRYVLTRLYNCPRCGDVAADRIWPLALAEAASRLGLPWTPLRATS